MTRERRDPKSLHDIEALVARLETPHARPQVAIHVSIHDPADGQRNALYPHTVERDDLLSALRIFLASVKAGY